MFVIMCYIIPMLHHIAMDNQILSNFSYVSIQCDFSKE